MVEPCDLAAVEARALIGSKRLSPVELLDSCIKRISALNPTVNAFVATCYERARSESKVAEAAVMRGDALPALHGLPLGIKDLEVTEGLRTTFGSQLFANNVPKQDEALIAAVRRAGAIVVGKTNTPEFGAGANTTNTVYGPTRNPFDTKRISGGSSGGSAVALACNMVPIATGSDLGGSVRTPAAYCGVVGFRPSLGVIPAETRPIGWMQFATRGPMGRTVADAQLLLRAMVGYDARDPMSYPYDLTQFYRPLEGDLSSLKVAISEDLGFAPVDDGIRTVFNAAVARFRHVFRESQQTDPPLQRADEIFEPLRAMDHVAAHEDKCAKTPNKVGPNVTANVKQGLAMSLADVARAAADVTELYRRFVSFMKDFDVLIAPAVSVPPFPVEQLYIDKINGRPLRTYFHWIAITYGLSLTGHPVVVLPCGRDYTGTPFGIQLCGRRGEDQRLLGIAAALESYLKGIAELSRPVPDIATLRS